MAKGLEALERIGKCYVANESKDLMFTDNYGNDYDIIEKELKALKIIVEKRVDIFLIEHSDTLSSFNEFAMIEITEQEFNLLKEVLDNE